jgi:hypothetical protein
MRYVGEYTEREIAETSDIRERIVQRDWERTRKILVQALR